MSEKVLFEANERDRFKNWYRLYYPMVKRLVIDNGGSKEDAEDVFQEMLIVLIEKTRNKDFSLTSKESTYIYSIAQNKWRDYSRKKNKSFPISADIDLNELEIVDDNLYDSEKEKHLERLRACFEKLSETRKTIIHEYYYSKYSMKEIAAQFGFENDDSVKSQKYKAIMDLKKCKEIINT